MKRPVSSLHTMQREISKQIGRIERLEDPMDEEKKMLAELKRKDDALRRVIRARALRGDIDEERAAREAKYERDNPKPKWWHRFFSKKGSGRSTRRR